ncbi:MAG: 23S rRNA (adenine(2503)-C(2))-methyltransferase RlmN [Thermomicrobiales bacterium]
MIAIEDTTTTDAMARPAARARFKPHSVFEYTLDELTDWFRERGEPAYRAKQLYNWVFRNFATDYSQVTVLPVAMRARLAEDLPIQALTPIHEVATDDGETVKMLYQTADGQTLETVLMFYPDRSTVCVSCQVGCAVGCSFCATGLMGLQRNLSAGEMVAQVVDVARRSKERGRPLTNIVMMGMGEPFHNYENVMKMVAILNQPEGMRFGSRRITVSTSGVVPFIDKLATEPYQVNLAISIHAANDELRSTMVPLNRRWPLNELIASVRRYIGTTRRRVSFEYVLIASVNDSDDDARQLAKRLKGLLCHVNLIPLNPTPAFPYERPSAERIDRFAEILNASGIPATVRYSRGVEIAAACGQLHVEQQKRDSTPVEAS